MGHGSGQVVPALPAGHVARPRLVRALASSRLALVHAHGGWGKSTLAVEAAATHQGEVVWVDLSGPRLSGDPEFPRLLDALSLRDEATVADVMARRRRTLVVVDDVDQHGWKAVARLAAALPEPHRLIGLGRTAPPGRGQSGAVTLTTADLAFTVEEFQLLLEDHVPGGVPAVMAERLQHAVGGWGIALRAIAAALGRSAAPLDLGRRLLADNVVLADVVADLLDPLEEQDRAVLAVAAQLPHLDRRLAERLGLGGAIGRSQSLGLPWETPPAAVWTLPDPIRELLVVGYPLAAETLETIVHAYADGGHPLHGCRVALEHDADDLAAQVLAEAPSEQLTALHKPTVLALIETLDPDMRRRQPWLDVQVARLLTAAARYDDRNDFVLEARTRHHDRPDVVTALDAERFRDLAYFSPAPSPDDVARIDALLEDCDDPGVRSRLEQGRALLQARADGVSVAENGLRRAAEQAEQAGEPKQAALALRDLAWVVLLEQGRLKEVIETFDEVERIVGADSTTTSWRINRADTHLLLGELDAAEQDLQTATRLAELHHDEQHVAYAAWARATLESLRGRRLQALAAVKRAEALAGSWIDTVTGVLFHAQCADALARVGLEEEARARLGAAAGRRDDDERAVLLAELAVEGRLGDPAAALEAAGRLEAHPLEPSDEPRVQLLTALALHRDGRDAREKTAEAAVAYEAAGLLHTARLFEPQACAALGDVARQAGVPLTDREGAGARTPPATQQELAEVLQRRHGLRPREAEVVLALRTGGTNAQIAEALSVSESTVRKHLQHAYATLEVRSRAEALVFLGTLESGQPAVDSTQGRKAGPPTMS